MIESAIDLVVGSNHHVDANSQPVPWLHSQIYCLQHLYAKTPLKDEGSRAICARGERVLWGYSGDTR